MPSPTVSNFSPLVSLPTLAAGLVTHAGLSRERAAALLEPMREHVVPTPPSAADDVVPWGVVLETAGPGVAALAMAGQSEHRVLWRVLGAELVQRVAFLMQQPQLRAVAKLTSEITGATSWATHQLSAKTCTASLRSAASMVTRDAGCWALAQAQIHAGEVAVAVTGPRPEDMGWCAIPLDARRASGNVVETMTRALALARLAERFSGVQLPEGAAQIEREVQALAPTLAGVVSAQWTTMLRAYESVSAALNPARAA